MKKNTLLILIGVAISTIALLGLLYVQVQKNKQTLMVVYDSVVLDNVNHYLPCEQLPSKEQANAIVQEHRDVIEKIIKDISLHHEPTKKPEVIWDETYHAAYDADPTRGYSIAVIWDSARDCEGTDRAELFIPYDSHADRVIIENIINSTTFFGLPYRLQNS